MDGFVDENYRYDEIGNLISDAEEGIDSIAWTSYGKVRQVEKSDNSLVSFRYDAAGNRIAKIAEGDTTVYVRDASGNVMGVYKNDTLVEQSIYGSSRLGLMTASSKTGCRTLGGKKYELSNHLGNVLAVVTDNINLDQDSTWANVVNMTAYYPFGLAMDGRTLQDSTYRYGFNGHEKDDEVKGSGNHISFNDYGYDPRTGGRWRTDPAFKEYPSISPYAGFGNNPLIFTDPDGKRLYFVGGANNDQDGWNYKQRFKQIFESKGIKDVRTMSASHGKMGDIAFTHEFKNFSEGISKKVTSKMIQAATNAIVADLATNPLGEGEQLNIAGYSYGSVLQAHVAIALADIGIKVDNLSLIGSPISDNSSLMETLNQYKKDGKIGEIQRVDIEGDKLSNPSNELEYYQGGIESLPSPLGKGDAAPHFDLARPGAAADKKIGEAAEKLKSEGVK